MKHLCALAGATSLLVAPSLFANISYEGTYTGTLNLSLAYGVANDTILVQSSGLGTFYSFCLNSSVDANSGQTYNYTSSETITPANNGGPTQVTLGTAWLYSEFNNGGLASYGYDGSTASANELQQAIWYLQGSPGGVDNVFVTDAQSALTGLNLGSETNAANGAFGVFALNLTDNNGGPAQPILGMVPEPSTVVAGVLLLLPFGVSTVRILRKDKVS